MSIKTKIAALALATLAVTGTVASSIQPAEAHGFGFGHGFGHGGWGIGAGLQAADVLFIFARPFFMPCRFMPTGFGSGGRGIAGGLQVFGDGLIFVEANAPRVGANESLIEDASGQLVELILLQRLQHAGADFGGDGNLLQRDFALLAFLSQLFAKGGQTSLLAFRSGANENFTLLRSKIIENW